METEAYSQEEEACHGFNKRTKTNQTEPYRKKQAKQNQTEANGFQKDLSRTQKKQTIQQN